ncbi:MAG: hypothetical protein QUV05_08115 [Phycisphaerae bacterium]|nr:hypothetical protein [Phycisphaerae bacterium]
MTPEELKTIVDQVTAAVAPRPTPPTPPAMAPMMPLSTMVMPPAGNMAMPPAAAPIGVTVAITIPLPDGSEASGQLQLSPEAMQNLPGVVASLLHTGWPVRTFQPRQNMGGWGNNRGYRGRSWRS